MVQVILFDMDIVLMARHYSSSQTSPSTFIFVLQMVRLFVVTLPQHKEVQPVFIPGSTGRIWDLAPVI